MNAHATGRKAIRIAIVEDDARVRESLAILVDGTNGLQCVGTFPNAEAALAKIPSQAPDVVLMDINLGGTTGIECVRSLKEILPNQVVVMLTAYEDDDIIFDALKAGANGYLVKQTPPNEILAAIVEVHSGGAPMSGSIARKVIQSFHSPSEKRSGITNHLTQREKEVLDFLARGYLYKEIAGLLGISVHTVKEHIQSIYNKMHVRSRSEAIQHYLRGG